MAALGSCLSGARERGKGLGKLLVRRDWGCGDQHRASLGVREVWGSCPSGWEGVGCQEPPVIRLEISHELCTSQTRPA